MPLRLATQNENRICYEYDFFRLNFMHVGYAIFIDEVLIMHYQKNVS